MLRSLEEVGKGSGLTCVALWFSKLIRRKQPDLRILTHLRTTNTAREKFGEMAVDAWHRTPACIENRALSRLYEAAAAEFFNYPRGYYFYSEACIEIMVPEERPRPFFEDLFGYFEMCRHLSMDQLKARLDEALAVQR